jgi:hypothetical protein
METIYIGVDFHARQQTICYLKTETGELVTCELKHQDKEKVRVSTPSSAGTWSWAWKPVVTAPGSNECSRNWVAKSGLGMLPRSAAGLVGGRRMIGATRNSFWS